MNRGDAGALAGAMLMRGTRKHTRQQLAGRVRPAQGARQRRRLALGRRRIDRDHAREPAGGADLVAEVLREPAFDPKEFEQLRTE